tara:strand:- start:152 stop:379 length:228 start_codon:yes stop_codon:yes gene_type:complete
MDQPTRQARRRNVKPTGSKTGTLWHSVNEIAEHLGVSRETVYIWLKKHKMPGHKVGRLWKFSHAEVDAWVKGETE